MRPGLPYSLACPGRASLRAGILRGSGPSLLYQWAELVNVHPGVEHHLFFVPSSYLGPANGDSELIQVKEDGLLVGSPIGRCHGDDVHSPPDPRAGTVLPFHICLLWSSPAPAGYQKESFEVRSLIGPWGSAGAGRALALWWMYVGSSNGEENSNLYTRGVNEGRAGEVLDGEELLEVLDVFGEDGLRSYLMGHIEGVADAMEDHEE